MKRAVLGGRTLDSVHFADPACEPGVCPAVAARDDPARSDVTVEDAAGTVTHVVDQSVRIPIRGLRAKGARS